MFYWNLPFRGGKDAKKETFAALVGPGSSAGLYYLIFPRFYSRDEETATWGYKLVPDHETCTWRSQTRTWFVWLYLGG